MRKITRPGQAAIATSATKDDAIDVEGTDTDTSAFPRAAGGLRKLFQLPAASNGGADAGTTERRQRRQRRAQADRRPSSREAIRCGGEERAHQGGAGQGGAGQGRDEGHRGQGSGTASACRRVGGRTERELAPSQQQEAQTTLSPSRRSDPTRGGEHVPPEHRERAITMEWVETTGRTIAEALDAALDELGVDEDDVEYEVLEQPKSGFLGRLGSSEGRIRARVKPISREKPGERQAPQRPGPEHPAARRERQRGQQPGPRQCAERTGRRRTQRRAVGRRLLQPSAARRPIRWRRRRTPW